VSEKIAARIFSETDFGEFFQPTSARTRTPDFALCNKDRHGLSVWLDGTNAPGIYAFDFPILQSVTPTATNATAETHT
jgi:hypothetical protein